jgi:hypothetical protein
VTLGVDYYMRKIRSAYFLILLTFLIVVGSSGCGSREKWKNSDFDRPKATEKK